MQICKALLCATACALALAGCSNPYALKTSDIRYDRPQTEGVIRFADPKIYRREALINERRDELDYLKTLRDGSRTIAFNPEIIRELETIQSFAGALGFTSDPLSELKFERDRETSSLGQQIDVMKLQLQLDQLKRDADLYRARMSAQTDPSNATLPAAPDSADPTAASSAASLAKLDEAIGKLTTSLQARFGDVATAPRKAGGEISPIDLFQQRAAYRNLIQGAMNAASLDEMHDANGAALIRLEFSTTVFPPTSNDYADTFGMLRMKVRPPTFADDADARNELYWRWLNYINMTINSTAEVNGDADRQNQRMLALGRHGGFFDIRYIGIDRKPVAVSTETQTAEAKPKPASRAKPAKPAKPVAAPATPPPDTQEQRECRGVWLAPKFQDDCRYFAIALPVNSRPDLLNNIVGSSQAVELMRKAAREITLGVDAATRPLSQLGSGCKVDPNTTDPTLLAILTAQTVEYSLMPQVSATLSALTTGVSGAFDSKPFELGLIEADSASKQLLAVLARKETACALSTGMTLEAPDAFRTFLERGDNPALNASIRPFNRVTLYQVGPREESQIMSSVARAADALSLGAAISAANPGAGQGINAAMNLSRSAMGKVDALERAPLVISFAEAGAQTDALPVARARDGQATAELLAANPAAISSRGGDIQGPASFGWLLGPRVTLDPEQNKLLLQHRPVPHQLFVDLSVPGWWPYLYLDTESVWSPQWTAASSVLQDGVPPRRLKVYLEPNNADMAGLTGALASYAVKQDVRIPAITGISPLSVSKCATDTTLRIWGENIWRAGDVMVGGKAVSGESVRVLPDMSGVSVLLASANLPAIAKGKEGATASISVLTPYGPADAKIGISDPDKDCSKAAKDEAEAKKGDKPLAIKTVTPTQISICDPSPTFTITGDKLDTVSTVLLGTVQAAPAAKLAGKETTTLVVNFPKAELRNRLAGLLQTPLTVRASDGSLATASIGIINAACTK